MFPVHEIARLIVSAWLPELAKHTGRPEAELAKSGLSASDFAPGTLRVDLMDGSHVEFHCAFHVVSERQAAIAVFTEHCGHHAFPIHEARVLQDGRQVYAHDVA